MSSILLKPYKFPDDPGYNLAFEYESTTESTNSSGTNRDDPALKLTACLSTDPKRFSLCKAPGHS